MADSHQPTPPNESHELTATAKPVSAPILDSEPDTTRSYDQSPVHQILEIPELLEQILSFVLSLDLCRARRTSRIFRNTIDRSLVLQKNMFLIPYAPAPSTIPYARLTPQSLGAPDFANCLLIDQRDFDVALSP